MKPYKQLTSEERDQLAVWKASGLSNKECARRLGRNPATIGRELKRNDWHSGGQNYYVAIHAQAVAQSRAIYVAHSKPPLKNPAVFSYVTDHLRRGWSPDDISGRLNKNHLQDKSWWISTETIYRWIYDKQYHQNDPELWFEYLRRKQKRRKKQKGRTAHRSHIPDRVSIHMRPEAVNMRTVFGHWEGDTVEGKGRKASLHTEVERVSRLIAARKVAAITSREAVSAQLDIFRPLPRHARQSTTLDNGRETHLHTKLRIKLGMETYHADPYSSWQRGTNEHGNWHLRYYFPKGTDFNSVTDEELQDVVWEINNRPRKILNYKTAQEVYNQLLARGCTSK